MGGLGRTRGCEKAHLAGCGGHILLTLKKNIIQTYFLCIPLSSKQ